MSQGNVEIVRRGLEAFNRGDFDAALQDFAPGAIVDWSQSRGPDAGVYVGREQIRQLWTEVTQACEQSTMIAGDLVTHGEHVLVPVTGRLTARGGMEVEVKTVMVASFRDGQMVRWAMYQDRADALRALGLGE